MSIKDQFDWGFPQTIDRLLIDTFDPEDRPECICLETTEEDLEPFVRAAAVMREARS